MEKVRKIVTARQLLLSPELTLKVIAAKESRWKKILSSKGACNGY